MLIGRWVTFIGKSEDLKEVIAISKGYILLVWGYISSFLDEKEDYAVNRFRKRVTAGMVLHFHKVQFTVLAKYLEQRQKNVNESNTRNQHINFYS